MISFPYPGRLCPAGLGRAEFG